MNRSGIEERASTRFAHERKDGQMSDSQLGEPEVDWRTWTMDHAKLVRAFESVTFAADGDEETSLLAAGALIMAATQIIDELFQDIETLATDGSVSVADSEGAYFVLEDLPQRFAQQYNGRFVRNFHVATVMVTGRPSAEQVDAAGVSRRSSRAVPRHRACAEPARRSRASRPGGGAGVVPRIRRCCLRRT
jgi:hypothetical protein